MAYTTIDKSTDHFSTVLYTGNGGTQSITGVGHQTDFIWVKARDGATNYYHYLQDTVRGTQKILYTNGSDAEQTITAGINTVGSDGWTTGSQGALNDSGDNFVAWNWKGGTTSGLSGGTITPSAYSYNATSGFGIYKYTGNSTAGASIAHGLGKVPKMIIVKRLDTAPNWQIYHEGMGNGKWLEFTTGAQQTGTTRWNDTSPTNTLFYLGTDSDVNNSSGTYIAYVFCEVTGHTKFGSYVGNSNANGKFIYTGFKPSFVLVKMIDGSAHWQIADTKRPTYNPRHYLRPNSNALEGTDIPFDILSNGFKARSTDTSYNGSSNTYIYYAVGQTLVGSNNVPAVAI